MGLHGQTIELFEQVKLCLDIIKYVNEYGFRAAERKYGINRYRIRKMMEYYLK